VIPVYLSLGTNTAREHNIRAGLQALAARFGNLEISPVYQSTAVGTPAQNYYNLAIGLQTDLTPAELRNELRGIEAELGRDRADDKQVPIDLDILLYDNLRGEHDGVQLPHPDLLAYEHVLRPLADIAGEQSCPGDSTSFAEMLEAGNFQPTIVTRVDS